MAAVAMVRRLNIRPAAACGVVGSKRGRFEPSTAAKPSENPGHMPMTPEPILNALPPPLWVHTAECHPSACLSPCIGPGPGSPGLRTGPTSHSAADHDRLGRDPSMLFTAPLLHTPSAFRPEHSINPTITHWPPPEAFITGARSGQFPSKAKTRQFHCSAQ